MYYPCNNWSNWKVELVDYPTVTEGHPKLIVNKLDESVNPTIEELTPNEIPKNICFMPRQFPADMANGSPMTCEGQIDQKLGTEPLSYALIRVQLGLYQPDSYVKRNTRIIVKNDHGYFIVYPAMRRWKFLEAWRTIRENQGWE